MANKQITELTSAGALTLADIFLVRQDGDSTDKQTDGTALVTLLEANISGFSSTGHNHTLSDITDSGDLASLDSVTAGEIDSGAVTEDKLDVQNSPSDGQILAWNSANSQFEWVADQSGGGGSSIVLDLGNDSSIETSALDTISTSGDTNSIFGNPNTNELRINVGSNWPVADTVADGAIDNSKIDASANIALSKLATDPLARGNHTGTQSAGTVSGGTFADALIAESNVTQHETALTVTESQISDLGSYIVDVVSDTTPQLGGDLDAQQNVIKDFESEVTEKTSTSETLASSDTGRVIEFNNSSAITVTLPNDIPIGWHITWAQTDSGTVTFSAASGATIQNRQSHTDSAGQWAMGTLYVTTNSDGSSAVYVLAGDTA